MEQTYVPGSLDILTFRVGPFLLGVDSGQVVWLSRMAPRAMALQLDEVAGRARVLDLRETCGLDPVTEEEQQLLVVGRGGDQIAYLVDQVGEFITVDMEAQIWPLPPLVEAHKCWRQLWGVCHWRDELVLLVDLKYEPSTADKRTTQGEEGSD